MSDPLPRESSNITPLHQHDLLKVEGLSKTFHQGEKSLLIFNQLNLRVEPGEIVALVGPSGAGKSTFLQMVGLLDRPSSGRIFINGQEACALGETERTKLRREFIGFVYQFHYLQPEFSALENVVIPQMIAGKKKSDAMAHAQSLLSTLGLSERLDHRPARLSGGEQQRVAIARALANNPSLLLADEPTGNLDPQTSADVFEMLLNLVRKSGLGAIIATHNIDLADQMDRVLELKNGKLIAF
jgi:lipoprotein-releasing system ATP-binding protein